MFTSELKSIPSDDSYIGINFLVRTPKQWMDSAINWQDVPPSFFSNNCFTIDVPVPAVTWLGAIGSNIQHLREVRIIMPADWQDIPPRRAGVSQFDEQLQDMFDLIFRQEPPSGPLWCKVFDELAVGATGLQSLFVYWDAEGFIHHGGGADVDVVRALGRIKGLQRMEIRGFYAKEWPKYLEEKMGIKVLEDSDSQMRRYLKNFQRDHKEIGRAHV